jgi:glycosyltransferase involved in cell wall biosynthesis
VKLTLITVTFNSEDTLADTVESVLGQDYGDYEYIIVDGGSEDGTLEIIQQFEPRFGGRMRWISEPDNGMYDAINKGIKMATGDVVGIINSDDFYHRNDIFRIVNDSFLTNPVIQAIYGDVRFVNPDNLEKTVRYYSSKSFSPSKFKWGWMPAHPSFFTYRENFEKYGLYRTDYHIAADYELLMRFLNTNKLPSMYVPVDFMKMRTGGRSTSGIKSNILLNKEIVRACRENGVYTNLPMLFMKYFVKVFEFVFTKD